MLTSQSLLTREPLIFTLVWSFINGHCGAEAIQNFTIMSSISKKAWFLACSPSNLVNMLISVTNLTGRTKSGVILYGSIAFQVRRPSPDHPAPRNPGERCKAFEIWDCSTSRSRTKIALKWWYFWLPLRVLCGDDSHEWRVRALCVNVGTSLGDNSWKCLGRISWLWWGG